MGNNHVFPGGDAKIQKPVAVLSRPVQALNPERLRRAGPAIAASLRAIVPNENDYHFQLSHWKYARRPRLLQRIR